MASTYTLISSYTATGSESSTTFSSVPSTYTDLVIRMSFRYSAASSVNSAIAFNISGTKSETYLYGDGSAAASGRDSLLNPQNVNAATYTANAFSNSEYYIPNYTSSNNKCFSSFGVTESNSATGVYMMIAAMLLQATGAITSITIGSSGVFAANSTFYLYGISSS